MPPAPTESRERSAPQMANCSIIHPRQAQRTPCTRARHDTPSMANQSSRARPRIFQIRAGLGVEGTSEGAELLSCELTAVTHPHFSCSLKATMAAEPEVLKIPFLEREENIRKEKIRKIVQMVSSECEKGQTGSHLVHISFSFFPHIYHVFQVGEIARTLPFTWRAHRSYCSILTKR